MDQRRFDDLTRLLGASGTRRGGLRAALGGLLGMGIGLDAAALDSEAKGKGRPQGRDRAGAAKRRHECGPDAPCPTGFDCVKQGRKRRCSCASGVLCAGACCPTGQVCQNGACVVPATCVAAGQPCKGVGVPCCEGRVCASGQGGENDVACYRPKTAACETTGDCVYGTTCVEGRCTPPPPPTPDPPQVIQGLGTPCVAARGDTCAVPDAECVAYDGPDAPNGEPGDYCTLPLNTVCTGDPDCTCYKCWYENPAPAGSGARDVSVAANLDTRLACCGPAGYTCKTDRNCCLGALCVNGVCQSETTCDVYASCPTPGNGCWTTIAAAYADTSAKPAGSTITIAPGTYLEPRITLNRDITFRRCGEDGQVIWQNLNNGEVVWTGVSPTAGYDLGLAFLELAPRPDSADFIVSLKGVSSSSRANLSAVGCTFRDLSGSYRYAALELGSFTDATLERCTFSNNIGGAANGNAIRTEGDASARNQVTVRRSTFTGNVSQGDGGAIAAKKTDLLADTCTFTGNSGDRGGAIALLQGGGSYPNYDPSTLTARDCTFSGNTATAGLRYGGGGAIWFCPNCTVAIEGATTVSGNTASTNGSGIRTQVYPGEAVTLAPGRITGTTAANVSGNISTPDCAVWDDDGSPRALFAVSCDGWCVPSGGACRDGVTTCCNGGQTCVSNVCA